MPNVEFKGSLNPEKIEAIIRVLRKQLQLVLFGVDIVIDNVTGNYAIIDINVYPGYEGYPNFFDHLVSTISDMIDSENNLDNRLDRSNEIVLELEEQFKNGFDNVYKESIDNLDKHCLINVNEFVRKNSESAL